MIAPLITVQVDEVESHTSTNIDCHTNHEDLQYATLGKSNQSSLIESVSFTTKVGRGIRSPLFSTSRKEC